MNATARASVPFTIRIPEDLYLQLKNAKWIHQKSVTKIVEQSIREFLEKEHTAEERS